MKRFFFYLSLSATAFFYSCGNDDSPFSVTENRVGKITKEVSINELSTLYAEDSIVNSSTDPANPGSGRDIEIYEKGGKLLLIVQPVQDFDSTSTIANIQIMDPRFETEKGLSTKSTFGDIVEEYSISRIENTLSSAVVFLDEINAYITIDKKQLPTELRFDTDTRIEPSQIPDDATFKYFMIGWN